MEWNSGLRVLAASLALVAACTVTTRESGLDQRHARTTSADIDNKFAKFVHGILEQLNDQSTTQEIGVIGPIQQHWGEWRQIIEQITTNDLTPEPDGDHRVEFTLPGGIPAAGLDGDVVVGVEGRRTDDSIYIRVDYGNQVLRLRVFKDGDEKDGKETYDGTFEVRNHPVHDVFDLVFDLTGLGLDDGSESGAGGGTGQ